MKCGEIKNETISINRFQNISEKEDQLINEEICRLLTYSFCHGDLRKEILHSALKLISANAPCTIFSMQRSCNISKTNIHSDRTFQYHHLNLPPDRIIAEKIEGDIENHINAVSSIIELDLHRLFTKPDVANLRGLYERTKILNRKCLMMLSSSAITSIEVGDIFFGWLRCNLNEIWIVALRRFTDQPKFSGHDYALLKTFVSRLYDFRNAWNAEDKNRQYLDVLTVREQEAIYHFVSGLKDKETAEQMNISKRTLDAHWQNIFNKIGVSDKILVLDKLGMITNKIPLETEKAVKIY